MGTISEIVPDIALDALLAFGWTGLNEYGRALRDACSASPPPYSYAWYGERYRKFASDSSWFADSLIANAAKEGEGAETLWQLAARIGDPGVSDLVARHAIDESRHARFYISLLKLTFPELQNEIKDRDYQRFSPGYGHLDRPAQTTTSPSDHVIDELIQMNLGEVRTLIHQMLMGPVIVLHSPLDRRRRMRMLMNGLGHDERRHIGYTAQIIDRAAQDKPKLVFGLMAKRLVDFNALTMNEIGLSEVDPGSYE